MRVYRPTDCQWRTGGGSDTVLGRYGPAVQCEERDEAVFVAGSCPGLAGARVVVFVAVDVSVYVCTCVRCRVFCIVCMCRTGSGAVAGGRPH